VREGRRLIHAEGEFQASQKLADAAKIIATEGGALQLRFLQTLTEIATEKKLYDNIPCAHRLISMFMGKTSK